MKIWGNWGSLSKQEEEKLHETALRILEEVGVAVENESVLRRLAEFGALVEFPRQRAFFKREFVEEFLENYERFDWENAEPYVGGSAAIYSGTNLTPKRTSSDLGQSPTCSDTSRLPATSAWESVPRMCFNSKKFRVKRWCLSFTTLP